MMIRDADLTPLDIDGRLWLRGALDDAALAPFDRVCDLSDRPGERMGPEMAEAFAQALAPGAPLLQALQGVMPGARPVRVVAFNKSEDRNWSVPWHQDRVVALREKAEAPGYDHWSCKNGVWHAEAPREVLDRMVFVRLHLDDATAENGAMELALGTHHEGVVPAREAEARAEAAPRESGLAARGDLLVVKMLTLHRSPSATAPSSRRSFRIDFADFDLPEPLAWAM